MLPSSVWKNASPLRQIVLAVNEAGWPALVLRPVDADHISSAPTQRVVADSFSLEPVDYRATDGSNVSSALADAVVSWIERVGAETCRDLHIEWLHPDLRSHVGRARWGLLASIDARRKRPRVSLTIDPIVRDMLRDLAGGARSESAIVEQLVRAAWTARAAQLGSSHDEIVISKTPAKRA
jgi:hypothetical protein